MRYQKIQEAVFQVFASPAWLSETIQTIPVNFVASQVSDEFVRVSVIPSGAGVNWVSASGLVIATIHVREGIGPSRATEIADTLDKYLLRNTLQVSQGTVQFATSSFAPRGASSASGFSAFEYSIPFNFFGVL